MSPASFRSKHAESLYIHDGWRKVNFDRQTHYLVHYYKGATYLALCGLILSPESFSMGESLFHCSMCERVLAWQQHTDSEAHGGK